MLSASDKLLLERIDDDYGSAPAQIGDVRAERYAGVRAQTRALARLIVESCPDGRERSTALTKLQEVAMWAQTAIARGEV